MRLAWHGFYMGVQLAPLRQDAASKKHATPKYSNFFRISAMGGENLFYKDDRGAVDGDTA
jgi:hypothetical protein